MKIPLLSSLSARKPSAPEPFVARDKARYEGTLVAHGLSKTYDTRRVVNGVSLVVRRGEAVGLLEQNLKEEREALREVEGVAKKLRDEMKTPATS